MILKYIKLDNIRSYLHQTIRFPEGSSLLCGDIGCGKSSILLAIEFGLFGIKRKNLSSQSLLRHGARNGSVELGFVLNRQNVVIKRNLTKTKGNPRQDAGYIIIDDQKTDATPVELRAKIYELLGYPLELLNKGDDLIFRYTVYTPQEEMKSILSDDSEKRLDILRRTFNIDKYKRIKDNVSSYLTLLRSKANECKGAISTLDDKGTLLKENEETSKKIDKTTEITRVRLEKLQSKKKEKEQIVDGYERQIREIFKIEQMHTSTIKNVSERYQILEELKVTVENINREIDKLRAEIKEHKGGEISNHLLNLLKYLQIESTDTEQSEKTVQDLLDKKESLILNTEKDVERHSQELKYLLEKLDDIKRDIDNKLELVVGISNKKEKIKTLETKINQKKTITEKLLESKDRIEEFNKNIHKLEAKIESSQGVVAKVIDLDNCPTCHQDIDSTHKKDIRRIHEETSNTLKVKIKSFEKARELDIKRQERLQSELDSVSKNEKLLEREKAEMKSMEQTNKEIDQKKKEIPKITELVAASEKKIKDLKEVDLDSERKTVLKFKELLAEIKESQRIKQENNHRIAILHEKCRFMSKLESDIENNRKDLEQLNKEKTQLAEKLSFSDKTKDKYAHAKTEFERSRQDEKEYEIDLAKLEKEKEAVSQIIDGLKKEVQNMTKIKQRLKSMLQLHNWFGEYFINTISSIERQVMQKIHSEFNELFVTWFKMLVEDETINVRLDDQFAPIIEQNGYETEVINLSGGEKTSLALAYRLALNKVINDLISNINTKDLIILDEPTDGFSTDQLDRIRDVLDELDIQQAILVSHEPKMESYVDNIMRIIKNEHISALHNV